MEIDIRGNRFVLLAEKAICWVEKSTLLISDLHLGKITHFRKEGIAVPNGAVANNFQRLDRLIDDANPKRIIFLGDLFHNQFNAEWDLFAAWREQHHYIKMIMVMGNHDILPLSLFLENDIEVYENEYVEDDFVFCHYPKDEPPQHQFIFAGHVHPVFQLAGRGRQYFKLPCFLVDANQAILPSFGVFTGGFQVGLVPGRKIYVLAQSTVFQVPSLKVAGIDS